MVKRRKKSKNKVVIKLTLFLALIGFSAFYFFYPKEPRPPLHQNYGVSIPAGFKSIGLDISHHQGKINWQKLLSASKQNNQQPAFIYLKATEGISHVDSQWKKNRKECLRLSIKHGAYHFFRPQKLPIPQAEHFLKHYQPKVGDLPPVLDVEREGLSDADLILNITKWLEYVEEQTGMRPIIYTSYNFYKTKFHAKFPNHKFWIAAYSRKPKGIMDNPQIIHWQFTETAQLPGHHVLVDMNVSKVPF